MGKLQDFVRECVVECKTRAEINTQSKAEVLLDKFAGYLDKNGMGGGVSSWNDLTDKPFGEVEVEILPETEVVFEYNEDVGMPIGIITLTTVPESGAQCTVVYNGETYICTANADNMLGNLGAISGGEDTGEPFVISAGETAASQFIVPLTEITSATVNIKITKTEPIPEKYLQEAPVFDLTSIGLIDLTNCSETISPMVTFAELKFSMEHFGVIRLKINSDTNTQIYNESTALTSLGLSTLYIANFAVYSGDKIIGSIILGANVYQFIFTHIGDTGTVHMRVVANTIVNN